MKRLIFKIPLIISASIIDSFVLLNGFPIKNISEDVSVGLNSTTMKVLTDGILAACMILDYCNMNIHQTKSFQHNQHILILEAGISHPLPPAIGINTTFKNSSVEFYIKCHAVCYDEGSASTCIEFFNMHVPNIYRIHLLQKLWRWRTTIPDRIAF